MYLRNGRHWLSFSVRHSGKFTDNKLADSQRTLSKITLVNMFTSVYYLFFQTISLWMHKQLMVSASLLDEGLVELLAGHMPHQVIHKLLHLLYILNIYNYFAGKLYNFYFTEGSRDQRGQIGQGNPRKSKKFYFPEKLLYTSLSSFAEYDGENPQFSNKNLRNDLDSAGGNYRFSPWDKKVTLPPADVIKHL